MKTRRIIVGAIGGDLQESLGKQFGAAVATRGCILLTGGRPQTSDEIKDAAMVGAAQLDGDNVIARLIGILPGGPNTWDQPSQRRLFLSTGLRHNVRNVINGLTPDVIVVFGGSRGTLAEAAFAKAAGKRLFFCNSLARLRSNLREHFAQLTGENFETYFEAPLEIYPRAVGTARTAKGLLALIGQTLEEAVDDGSVDHLIERAVQRTEVTGPTGFPGLGGDPSSKERFEAIVAQMSL